MKFVALITTIVAIGLFSAPETPAQDAVEESPEIYSFLFDYDDIRVLEMICQPGQGDAYHSHPKHVAMEMKAGVLRVQTEGAEPNDAEFEDGDIARLDPVHRHRAENIGDEEFCGILIEYKREECENGTY